VQACKILKKEFHTNWDSSDVHITAFDMKLDKEQNHPDQLGIVISNDDKLQFYLKQIYALNCIDKTEMVTWKNKPIIVKDDYTQSKAYLENLVKEFETYTQNSRGKTRKMGYESANHMADVGNEIRKYIQDIITATVADKEKTAENLANISKASSAKDAQIDSITAQIKLLTNTITLLSKLLANKENNSSRGNIGGGNSSRRDDREGGGLGGKQKLIPTRTKGTIAGPCGHHPVGV
jgi:hypothetical protein